MTVRCEVETLGDNGYGKLRHNKKLGETIVKCINNSHWFLNHGSDVPHNLAGEDLTFASPVVLSPLPN